MNAAPTDDAGTFPSVAVIGGGFSGIAMGVQLKRAGVADFTIFEADAEPGGTWSVNRYPGAEVDSPSHLYSFSFKRYNWRATHARQPELLEYIKEVVNEYDLGRHFSLRNPVRRIEWDDEVAGYHVTAEDGVSRFFNVVVSAVGLLSNPRLPDWEGLERFQGPCFHTQRWEDHDLTGKTVALVGVGSSGTQLAAPLADRVGRLLIFQREPGWISPKGAREFTPAEFARYTNPWRQRIHRLALAAKYERNFFRGGGFMQGSKRNQKAEAACRAFIDKVFDGHPELKEQITPKYPFFGKRPVKSDTFYPTLLRDDVQLVSHGVACVSEHGLVDAAGSEHEVDAIILATGFQAENFLATIEVVGRDGRKLSEVWREGAYAYLGLAVPSFPNLYMLYGPNTNSWNVLGHVESQARYISRCIQRMRRRGLPALEVRPGFVEVYNRWIQGRLKKTVWTEANNYFKSAGGKIVTQWPDGLLVYRFLTRVTTSAAMARRRR